MEGRCAGEGVLKVNPGWGMDVFGAAGVDSTLASGSASAHREKTVNTNTYITGLSNIQLLPSLPSVLLDCFHILS